ncbi:MFS transporter [Pseudonocardia lacus]|uniref:MFS transporter n=1 Tax=Pseudonocardia lacus TaxID=2835865 RepID=UPI001BDC1D3C|nr:MFS transporter [Pseudonocardia lacus]
MSETAPGGTTRMGARERATLLVLCGAIFLEGIDVAMLNVALPSIRADLGLGTAELSGVVSAYVLGYAGFMLLGGRAADLYGRRRMFLVWLVVFLVFSGIGGLATDAPMLLAARFVTGVAAAFLTPAGLALVTATFPAGPLRTRALGFYAGTASGGFSLGLVAGGLLTAVGWRWVFFAPVILSAIILVAAAVLVRDPGGRLVGGRLDLAGTASITAAMLLLAYGVLRLEAPGEGVATTVAVLVAGAALVGVFVAVERRSPAPLVRLGLLRTPGLARTNATMLLFLGAFAGFQFLVTLHLQELRGWTPLQTALAMLVIAIDTVLAPTLTTRLVNRFGHLAVLRWGLATAVLAYALFLPIAPDWTYALMLPSFAVLGIAFALAYGPLTMAATDGVDEAEHGVAGGLLYTSAQFGTALGLSAATAVHVGAAAAGATGVDALHVALLVPVAAAALGLVAAMSGRRRRVAVADPAAV